MQCLRALLLLAGLVASGAIIVAVAPPPLTQQPQKPLVNKGNARQKEIPKGMLGSLSRNFAFWRRAGTIYTSYKALQIRVRCGRLWRKAVRRDPASSNATSMKWSRQHDLNSERMIDLCLGLRGFYLKTGQFLGTRYDFMPSQYTRRLSALHDDVPPLGADEIRSVLESELRGPVDNFFTELDLERPIGSASVAQVHRGRWRATGEACAVKVQYPNAEALMKGDLRNLRVLAEFLQRTELKFDILSSIVELQRNIHNEFNFVTEATNMASMSAALQRTVPEVVLPRSLLATKRVLVMSFVDGLNLGRTSEFSNKGKFIPLWIKQQFGRRLLDVLSKAWGEMVFNVQFFNSDPHPGNICIPVSGKIGLLDWGQMKRISDDTTYNFARFVQAMNSLDRNRTCDAFLALGVKVGNPKDRASVEGIAVSMLDTRSACLLYTFELSGITHFIYFKGGARV